MWETFSYYGMRALLVYYMTRQLLIEQEISSSIYGLYTAFAYFTPIIGGTIADRWLGKRRAVIIGASVMAAGHFMMAFEPAFYFALATIALGNGLFLPTLPSQINDLYQAGDPRRPWAYNVYYVGVNVGGFLAHSDLRRHLAKLSAGTGASALPASACSPAWPSILRGASICRRSPGHRLRRQRLRPPRRHAVTTGRPSSCCSASAWR